jgi:hypothetical protein
MCALEVSFVRNDASIELSLSMCPCAIRGKPSPSTAGRKHATGRARIRPARALLTSA